MSAAAEPGRTAVFDLRDGYAGPVDRDRAGPAFADRLAAIAAAGGGVLYVPPGEWVVDDVVVVETPGTTVLGAGIRASRVRMHPEGQEAVLSVRASGVTVERLTVVGNLPTNDDEDVGYHGISVRNEDTDFVLVRDVVVEDAHGYGVGMQGGSFGQLVLENVTVLRCGNDGIDFKNTFSTGERCFLRRVSVVDFGKTKAAQAGIDVRSAVRLQGIEVLDVASGQAGIRFRPGDVDDVHGIGGSHSTIDGWFAATTGGGGVGVRGAGGRDITVGAGGIAGPGREQG